MTLRPIVMAATILLVGGGASVCRADWHTPALRWLGIGWSDGYHAYEGCPCEQIGRRKYPGYWGGPAYGGVPVTPPIGRHVPAPPAEPLPASESRPSPVPLLHDPSADRGGPTLPSTLAQPMPLPRLH